MAPLIWYILGYCILRYHITLELVKLQQLLTSTTDPKEGPLTSLVSGDSSHMSVQCSNSEYVISFYLCGLSTRLYRLFMCVRALLSPRP